MSLTHNERIKLTATYLNTAAGSCLTAGVIAPLAAAVFGLTGGAAPLSRLTLPIGVTMFLFVSLGLHLAARYALGGLRA